MWAERKRKIKRSGSKNRVMGSRAEAELEKIRRSGSGAASELNRPLTIRSNVNWMSGSRAWKKYGAAEASGSGAVRGCYRRSCEWKFHRSRSAHYALLDSTIGTRVLKFRWRHSDLLTSSCCALSQAIPGLLNCGKRCRCRSSSFAVFLLLSHDSISLIYSS